MSASLSVQPAVVVEFNAIFDDEDGIGMWIARSDKDGITAEAESKDKLMQRLSVKVPDVLESRTGRVPSNVHIKVNWQELRTVDSTELAIA